MCPPRPHSGSARLLRGERRAAEAPGLSRRDFLARSGSCGAYLLWMSAASSVLTRRLSAAEPTGKVVAEEPWARIERLHDGVWAIVSTPLASGDWTTLANGGIVAGSEKVLVIESFARAEGAAWAARQAEALTGRRPTDVVLTHYHGDHTNGMAGFSLSGEAPRIWMTPATRELLRGRQGVGNDGRDDSAERASLLGTAETLDAGKVTELDLGGRKVWFHPRAGHTASDVTIELDDPGVVFYGDLLWNRMFPNFRDTTPTLFAESLRAAMRQGDATYVPGHGPLARKADIELLLAVLAEVEAAARESFRIELTASEAAAGFQLSESLRDWTLFNPSYFEVAIGAWHRELAASPDPPQTRPIKVDQEG